MGQVVIKIEGMSCGHCQKAVEKALRTLPGVTGADVNLQTGEATVTITGEVAREQLEQVVATAGYRVVD